MDQIKITALKFSKTMKCLVYVIYKMTLMDEKIFEGGDLIESVYELIQIVKETIGDEIWDAILKKFGEAWVSTVKSWDKIKNFLINVIY